jgi:hypothetical protein
LPKIEDDEGDTPIIELLSLIPCKCVELNEGTLTLDKSLVSGADVGAQSIGLIVYDEESVKNFLSNVYEI